MTWLFQHAFWLIFGKMGLATIVAIAAVAVAIFLPPLRRPAIIVAVVAAALGTVYGWGVYDRHVLCTDQFAEAEKRFHELEERVTKQAEDDRVRLEGEIADKDKDIDTKVKDYEKKLADLKSTVCTLTDDDAGRLR